MNSRSEWTWPASWIYGVGGLWFIAMGVGGLLSRGSWLILVAGILVGVWFGAAIRRRVRIDSLSVEVRNDFRSLRLDRDCVLRIELRPRWPFGDVGHFLLRDGRVVEALAIAPTGFLFARRRMEWPEAAAREINAALVSAGDSNDSGHA